MKTPNLNTLSAELAKSDNPSGKNLDVVDVKITLALLGRKLRGASAIEALAILNALTARGGKR